MKTMVRLRHGMFFSALGFYSVCPGSDQYVLGAPLFKKAVIHLENGKKIQISAPENSDKSRFVQEVKYNGKNYSKKFLGSFFAAQWCRHPVSYGG